MIHPGGRQIAHARDDRNAGKLLIENAFTNFPMLPCLRNLSSASLGQGAEPISE